MIRVMAILNGQTRIVGHIRTMAGELLDFTEVIDSDACRIHFGAYQSQADIVIPSMDDVFGKVGYTGADQWRIWRHFAHHAARM